MAEGSLTISVEKMAPWYVQYLPQVLTAVLVLVFIALLYFLYKVMQRKQLERELKSAAETHVPAVRKKKKKKKKAKLEVVELPAEAEKVQPPPTEIKESVEHKPANKLEEIEKHLKEDERTVINILKEREGHSEQGTLRVVSGFPKSTLSRILKELEDRNVVYREKRGKKNLVFLRR